MAETLPDDTAGSEHIGQIRTVGDHRLGEGVSLVAVDLLSAPLRRDALRRSFAHRQAGKRCLRTGLAQQPTRGPPAFPALRCRSYQLSRCMPAVQACPGVPKHLAIEGGGYQALLDLLTEMIQTLGH
jgi:hypothetical protein